MSINIKSETKRFQLSGITVLILFALSILFVGSCGGRTDQDSARQQQLEEIKGNVSQDINGMINEIEGRIEIISEHIEESDGARKEQLEELRSRLEEQIEALETELDKVDEADLETWNEVVENTQETVNEVQSETNEVSQEVQDLINQ